MRKTSPELALLRVIAVVAGALLLWHGLSNTKGRDSDPEPTTTTFPAVEQSYEEPTTTVTQPTTSTTVEELAFPSYKPGYCGFVTHGVSTPMPPTYDFCRGSEAEICWDTDVKCNGLDANQEKWSNGKWLGAAYPQTKEISYDDLCRDFVDAVPLSDQWLICSKMPVVDARTRCLAAVSWCNGTSSDGRRWVNGWIAA